MKRYRLLRNNKESGPFSAEELIQMGFKPYDLIWEDGRSASWKYPGEFAEFKNQCDFTEEQPFDRFYKKPKPAIQDTLPESRSISVKILPEVSKTVTQKPRIRIKAESRKIETVVEQPKPMAADPVVATHVAALPKNPAIPMAAGNDSKPDWEKMWLDWEEEKKVVGSLKEGQKAAPVIETKFSQSLDDLKAAYADKVLKGKDAFRHLDKNKQTIAVSILAAVVLGIGILLGIKWSGNDETKSRLQSYDVVSDKKTPVEESLADDPANRVQTSQSAEPVVTVIPTVERKTLARQPNAGQKPINSSAITTKNGSAKMVLKNKGAMPSPLSKINKAKTDNNSSNAQTVSSVSEKTITADNNSKPLFPADPRQSSIKDYVQLHSISGNTSGGAMYAVDNISDIAIELVMIDLQYYDGSGRFKKGETVYVRNIGAGQSVTVKAPEDNTAIRITPRISMISSEAKNLYLIAD